MTRVNALTKPHHAEKIITAADVIWFLQVYIVYAQNIHLLALMILVYAITQILVVKIMLEFLTGIVIVI